MVLPLLRHIGWRRETTDPPFYTNTSRLLDPFSPTTHVCAFDKSPWGHLRPRVSKLFCRSSRSHSAASLLRRMLDPTYGGIHAFSVESHLALRVL